MILQNMLFPSTHTCEREGMFFNTEGVVNILSDLEYCVLDRGAKLRADTYFNSFSIAKWKQYTSISNLSVKFVLKGDFTVRVRHTHKMHNKILDVVIMEKTVFAAEKQEISLPVNIDANIGIYYFELVALGDGCEFWGGAYETDVSEQNVRDVKIAIGICTFRREPYIKHNLEIIREKILENPESPMYKKLEVFVSDNGKTLEEELNTDEIHIFPNRNLGGAGGFTRSLIEIKKVSEEKGITHVLLMDDDIRLNCDSLLRTYAMLKLIKSEHRDAFIGGHMLNIDASNIQSEAADHWDVVTHHPVKYNYDLENVEFIIKNEIEDSVNYLSWWYCCMPISVVFDTNLPLPIFIKRDDIEYGLRNGSTFIILNGICVWHEPFEYKYASYLEYYYFRNMCIMNSRHRLSFDGKRLIKEVRTRVFRALVRYRYKEAELNLLGVLHYLKGIDWLKSQDAEKLNAQVMKLGYKKEPLENFDHVFVHGLYERNLKPAKLRRPWASKISFNGWLLPPKRNVIVPAYQPESSLFYRSNLVFNYEEITNTGFITQKSFRDLFYILKMYRKTVRLIKKRYNVVTEEYRKRYEEITSIDFWNDYLFNEGEAEQLSSGLDEERRPKNTGKQLKELIGSYGLRFIQLLLFWLPVKKNRVMVYVHDRFGFTCNPKYVVKKLRELYGDAIEIIWVSMHPETCQEIADMGIEIVKSNSKRHVLKYFRTRFLITNDAFPTWALHKPWQKWMNTWHGAMNYKRIGYKGLALMSHLGEILFRIKNRHADFFLAGCESFVETTSEGFGFNKKIFVTSGVPRNDIFFEKHPEIERKVREHYSIADDVHLAIFAPTFRRGMKSNTYGMNFETVQNALTERFGGKWLILFRNHNFVKGKQAFYNGAIDVSSYHDMQELMYTADVIISDYSSALYDFIQSGKPAFVYAPDIDYYATSDRSFAYDPENWPYPIATSNEELAQAITGFDEAEFKTNVQKHLNDVGAYDDGNASKRAAEIVAKYCLKK